MRVFRPLVLGAALLAGCGHDAAPGESVPEVCVRAHHREEVHVSGFLVAPPITLGCRESCSLYLSSERNEPEGVHLTFDVGTGPRTMDAIGGLGPDAFPGQIERLSASDFVLRDDSRARVSIGDEVRVTGELWATERDGRIECSMRPTAVQAL